METMKELLAVLLIHETNFKVLHWMACGSEFDSYHKDTTSEYYDMCSDKADEVAEMILRMGGSIINYAEALDIIDDSELDHLMIKSDCCYKASDIQENSQIMFADILGLIETALQDDNIANNIKNVSIKASLESMHGDFDLQYRYLNKRRGC